MADVAVTGTVLKHIGAALVFFPEITPDSYYK